MAEEQPVFKVVDRRPFNPDGSPRELTQQEKDEAERAEKAAAVENAAAREIASQSRPAAESTPRRPPRPQPKPAPAAGDPLEDPASFPSLIMSLASNAAASLGMMPHPVSGETGVDLNAAKHWIDILGML